MDTNATVEGLPAGYEQDWVIQIPAYISTTIDPSVAATADDITGDMVADAVGGKYVTLKAGQDFDFDSFEVVDGPDTVVLPAGIRSPEAVLTSPLSVEEIRYRLADGYVTGRVQVGVDTLIDGDLGSVLDALSTALVGSSSLMDVSYTAVEIRPGEEVVFAVTGDPSLILND